MLKEIAVASVVLAVSSAVHVPRKLTHATDICDLYEKGALADGSQVRFRTVIVTDLSEHSALVDRSCPKTPLSFVLPKSFFHQKTPFMTALYGDMNDLSLRRMEIVATGRFTWNPQESPPGTIYVMKILKFRRLRR